MDHGRIFSVMSRNESIPRLIKYQIVNCDSGAQRLHVNLGQRANELGGQVGRAVSGQKGGKPGSVWPGSTLLISCPFW